MTLTTSRVLGSMFAAGFGPEISKVAPVGPAMLDSLPTTASDKATGKWFAQRFVYVQNETLNQDLVKKGLQTPANAADCNLMNRVATLSAHKVAEGKTDMDKLKDHATFVMLSATGDPAVLENLGWHLVQVRNDIDPVYIRSYFPNNEKLDTVAGWTMPFYASIIECAKTDTELGDIVAAPNPDGSIPTFEQVKDRVYGYLEQTKLDRPQIIADLRINHPVAFKVIDNRSGGNTGNTREIMRTSKLLTPPVKDLVGAGRNRS